MTFKFDGSPGFVSPTW